MRQGAACSCCYFVPLPLPATGWAPAPVSPVSCREILTSRNRTCRKPVMISGSSNTTFLYCYVTLYHEHATLRAVRHTLHDVYHTLHDVYRTSRDVYRTLRAVRHTLHDVYHTLHDVYRTSRDVCRTLRDVCHTLRDVHRTLRDVCRTLHDVCHTLRDVYRILPGTGVTGRCRYPALIDPFEYFSLKKGFLKQTESL